MFLLKGMRQGSTASDKYETVMQTSADIRTARKCRKLGQTCRLSPLKANLYINHEWASFSPQCPVHSHIVTSQVIRLLPPSHITLILHLADPRLVLRLTLFFIQNTPFSCASNLFLEKKKDQ